MLTLSGYNEEILSNSAPAAMIGTVFTVLVEWDSEKVEGLFIWPKMCHCAALYGGPER